MDELFKGFRDFQNFYGRDKKYRAAVHALSIIFEELGIEIEPEECFILYHPKDLGKFRKKTDLKKELKDLWSQHPYKEYTLDDGDFSACLKSMMRSNLIDYRKGNLHSRRSVIIRYKTGGARSSRRNRR